jgi:hypothetical protein
MFFYDNMILKYQLVGDPSTTNYSMCAGYLVEDVGSPNNHFGADAAASFFAHEATEVVTNYDQAWMKNGIENADLCSWSFGRALDPDLNNANTIVGNKKFFIQQNWVPKYGCSLSLPN